MEKNPLHRSGAKSTLCNFRDKSISAIVAHFYSYFLFLLCRDVMSVRNFNMFIRIF